MFIRMGSYILSIFGDLEKSKMYLSNLEDKTQFNNSVVILGNFDGLHKGHEKLIKKAFEIKNKKGGKVVLFTFYPHPLELIKGEKVKNLIFDRNEKFHIASSYDIDVLFEYASTKQNLKMEAEEFVKRVLVDKLDVGVVVVGEDFRFARNRSGNVEILRDLSSKYGYDVEIIDQLEIDGEVVSSTLLRDCVLANDFFKFKKFSGREYFIMGEVVHGKAIGRTLGYPTANISVDERKLPLNKGVYASRTYVDDRVYDSVSFVGNSLGDKSKVQFETFIFDFNEMIYGKEIKVEMVDFIRGQKEIHSTIELKEIIKDDIDKAKRVL